MSFRSSSSNLPQLADQAARADRVLQRVLLLSSMAAGFGAIGVLISGIALWQATRSADPKANAAGVSLDVSTGGPSHIGRVANQQDEREPSPTVSADPSLLPTRDIPLPSELSEPLMLGQSVGFPRSGSLFEGQQFPPGAGYQVRNPERAWATARTIELVTRAIAKTRAAYPRASKILIGDLSYRTGGQISGHRSHQSGRDIDIGFFHRRGGGAERDRSRSHSRLRDQAQELDDVLADEPIERGSRRGGDGVRRALFRTATRQNLQIPILLDFVIALAESHNQPDGVDWILLDYRVQEWLVEYAERSGYESALLDRLFQVPHGPSAPRGIVRHYPGHLDHMHVRFKCPGGDAYCQSPKLSAVNPPAP